MTRRDPNDARPTPPFPEQEQEPPGLEREMQPLATTAKRPTWAGIG